MNEDKNTAIPVGSKAGTAEEQRLPLGKVAMPGDLRKGESEASSEEETATTRAIRKWVSRRVHSSPLSRNTEAYNYLMKQLPELASMIDEENKA